MHLHQQLLPAVAQDATLPVLLGPTPDSDSDRFLSTGKPVDTIVKKSTVFVDALPTRLVSQRSLDHTTGRNPSRRTKLPKTMGHEATGAMGRLKDDPENGSMRMERRFVLGMMQPSKTHSAGMDVEYYDKYWSPEINNHDEMALSGLIVNMCSDLIPPGLLPLSGCMASSGVGWLPSAMLVIVFFALSSHTLTMVAKTVNTLEVSARDPPVELTFEGIWKAVVGRASWIPPLAVLTVCFGNCIAYSCFFADLLVTALPGLGAPVWMQNRFFVLLTVSVFPLLPLCMLRDLSSLAPSSAAGIAMVIYTAGFMAYRAFDGSYRVDGQFHSTIPQPLSPEMSVSAAVRLGSAPLLLINALALGYLAHYNGMKYYRELRNHTVQRFKIGVRTAMGLAAFVYILTMWLGYYTFGDNAMGVILSNYDSSRDVLATIARVGMGFSIVFSYPLMFGGLREAAVATLRELTPGNEEMLKTIKFLHLLTFIILSAITLIAATISDVSLVVGVVGSLLGSAIIYILPTTLFIQAHKSCEKFYRRVLMAKVILVLGMFLGIFGCYTVMTN